MPGSQPCFDGDLLPDLLGARDELLAEATALADADRREAGGRMGASTLISTGP
jgi:hypothetical protein